MNAEDSNAKNPLDNFAQNAWSRKGFSTSSNEAYTATPFELLKQQLATGEITLHEYMIICQALTS